MMDSNKLKGLIIANGLKIQDVAKILNINKSTFSNKMYERNNQQFTQKEMMKIKERFNLSSEEFIDIFFSKKVS